MIWFILLLSACIPNVPLGDVATPIVSLPSPTQTNQTMVATETATKVPISTITNTPIITEEPTLTPTNTLEPTVTVTDLPTITLTLTPAGDYGMGSDIIEITGTIGALREEPYDIITYIAPFTPTGAGVAYIDIIINENTEIIKVDGTRGSVNDLVIGMQIKAIGTMGGSIGAQKIFILE